MQHYDSRGFRLLNSSQPVQNRDAERPGCSLERNLVVVPRLGEEIGVIGNDMWIRSSSDSYEPFRPDRVLSVM